MKPRKPDVYRHLPAATSARRELRRQSFDAQAELYDRARPAYPEPLFDDLVELSGIPAGGRILEIGPGTGRATLPLARRGFSILGLEPGAALAAVAARKLAGFPDVEVRNLAFEDWPVEPGRFDLVLAAESFHWLRPLAGLSGSALALKPGGSLALVAGYEEPGPEPIRAGLDRVYRELAPRIVEEPLPPAERIRRQAESITGSGHFAAAVVRQYPRVLTSTADEYVDLLRTRSNHALLEPATQQRLYAAIRELIGSLGGSITRRLIAVLFLARPRPRA
jgi:SAM-dependent methyltransferase